VANSQLGHCGHACVDDMGCGSSRVPVQGGKACDDDLQEAGGVRPLGPKGFQHEGADIVRTSVGARGEEGIDGVFGRACVSVRTGASFGRWESTVVLG